MSSVRQARPFIAENTDKLPHGINQRTIPLITTNKLQSDGIFLEENKSAVFYQPEFSQFLCSEILSIHLKSVENIQGDTQQKSHNEYKQ